MTETPDAGTQAGLRPWDEYDVYLFDIDGTLLNCTDTVHYFAFCDTLTALAGRTMNLDGVNAHGNTDVGILRDALHVAGVAEEIWRPRLASARDAMCRFVEQRTEELSVCVMPGAAQVLDRLRGRGALAGVATGNLERIGRAKLARCGLLTSFDFGAYSDRWEHRRDVFSSAVEMAREFAGDNASICAVGDTPSDVRAARANSLDVIAVATGVFSFEELEAEKPDRCLRSLEELLGH